MLSYECTLVGDFFLVKIKKKKNHAWLIGPEKKLVFGVQQIKRKSSIVNYSYGLSRSAINRRV